MAGIFIACAPEDSERAAPLSEALVRAGHAKAASEDAAVTIVIWTAAARTDAAVRATAARALEAGQLIQASLDGAVPPMPFNMLHAVPLDGWQGEESHPEWAKIRERIAGLTGDD